MTPGIPLVELPASLARALATGHPWVYRDHVPRAFEAPTGTFVRVVSGTFSAVALWDGGSPLALRIFSRSEVPTPAWALGKVRAALELRDVTGVSAAASAYRWLNGEGDGVPGVVVDRYGAFATLSTDTDALEPLVPWMVQALRHTGEIQGIVRRVRSHEGGQGLEVLHGKAPPRDLVVEEHGARFLANLHEGQKTGLFLDQRDNRRFIGALAADKTVLNLFGYTGGFSVHAAQGGAASVTTVDTAERALADARRNFSLNGLDPDAYEFTAVDAFEFLRAARERRDLYDVVICDPPTFARSRAHRDRAVEAYVRLHAAAFAVTASGGLCAASSCTTQVSVEAFHGALAAAARKAGVVFQIVHDAGHAPDHPILAGHPEGRYLKFVVGRVTAR